LNLKYSLSFLLLSCTQVLAQPTDLDCLTSNIYHEARGESTRGMRAIADVTLNRVQHPAFVNQDSVCKVVFAPSQFSWVKQQPKKVTQRLLRGDTKGLKDKDVLAYQKAAQIATEALSEGYQPLLPSSVVSFHNTKVNPRWNMKRYGVVGNHVFYNFRSNKV
jgi:spore germination cell wall hydrolase CwlJ-like protein